MPYLKLFHGRSDLLKPLDDGGEPGPIFGPFPFFHVVQSCEIQFDHGEGLLKLGQDTVYYDGMFYGDWSLFEGPPNEEDAYRQTVFDAGLAQVPDQYCQCECQLPGYLNCGVPGILAHFENGRLPPHGKVERCDQCQRYPSDEAARQDLLNEGLIWEQEAQSQLYSVHCDVTVTVTITGIAATAPQEAARTAWQSFNWDEHRCRAEFAEEITEYLVDRKSDADFTRSQRFNSQFEEIKP